MAWRIVDPSASLDSMRGVVSAEGVDGYSRRAWALRWSLAEGCGSLLSCLSGHELEEPLPSYSGMSASLCGALPHIKPIITLATWPRGLYSFGLGSVYMPVYMYTHNVE